MARSTRSFCAACLILRSLVAPRTEAFTFPLPHASLGLVSRTRSGPGPYADRPGDARRRSCFIRVRDRAGNDCTIVVRGESTGQHSYQRSGLHSIALASQQAGERLTLREGPAAGTGAERNVAATGAGATTVPGARVRGWAATAAIGSLVSIMIFFLSFPFLDSSMSMPSIHAHIPQVHSLTTTAEKIDIEHPAQRAQHFEQLGQRLAKTSPVRTARQSPPSISRQRLVANAEWALETSLRAKYLPGNIGVKAAKVPMFADFAKMTDHPERGLSRSAAAVKDGEGFGSGWELPTSSTRIDGERQAIDRANIERLPAGTTNSAASRIIKASDDATSKFVSDSSRGVAGVVGIQSENNVVDKALSTAAARVKDIASEARAALGALDFTRVSEQAKDVSTQGHETVDHLHAEPNRILADLDIKTVPLADRLFTGTLSLPQAARDARQALARIASKRFSESHTSAVSSIIHRLGRLGTLKSFHEVTGATRHIFEQANGRADGVPAVHQVDGTANDGLTGLSQGALAGISGSSAWFKDIAKNILEVQAEVLAFSSQVAEASHQAAAQAGSAITTKASQISDEIRGILPHVSPSEFTLDSTQHQARGALTQFSGNTFRGNFLGKILGSFSGKALEEGITAMSSTGRRLIADIQNKVLAGLGSETWGTDRAEILEFIAAGGAALSLVALVARDARTKARGPGSAERDIGSFRLGNEREAVDEMVGRPLQPIGVNKEAVAAFGVNTVARCSPETVSAVDTLWNIASDDDTSPGDGVSKGTQGDLLSRTARVGEQLRATSQGLGTLKAEVIALRKSIRDNDLEGKAKALREDFALESEGRTETG